MLYISPNFLFILEKLFEKKNIYFGFGPNHTIQRLLHTQIYILVVTRNVVNQAFVAIIIITNSFLTYI